MIGYQRGRRLPQCKLLNLRDAVLAQDGIRATPKRRVKTLVAERFQRFLVNKNNEDQIERGVEWVEGGQSFENELTIRTHFSSLNYKDALACEGHPGVVRELPQVPGIDCVGEIVDSKSERFAPGDTVIVGNASFGTTAPGGWSEWVNVPADWVLPLPEGLSAEDAIALGTAGFTAAGCVEALLRNGVGPGNGKVLVTGSTGGVGIFSVMLLAKLGFEVAASTGKREKDSWLISLGASEIVSREDMVDESDRPLLKGAWAGGVDTVGGTTLATFLRSTQIGGAVSACGVVAGPELPITVYPFILRGVSLCGIDSANTPLEQRKLLWSKLANEWKLDGIGQLTKTVRLDSIESEVQNILGGKVAGRVVLDLRDQD